MVDIRTGVSPKASYARTPLARRGWTAIVLAGRRPGIDPLESHFGVVNKALIELDGEPMLGRVLRNLCDVPDISNIVVLAQDAKEMASSPGLAWTLLRPSISWRRSGSGIAASLIDAIALEGNRWPVLVTTADNALLTPEIVAHFIAGSEDCDLAVGVVSRATLTAAYPESVRSWLKFRDEAYTGANLFAFRSTKALRALDLWQRVEKDRKSLVRVASRFGPWLLLRVVFRTIAFREAISRAGRRLELLARPVILPFADAGIDVDKPSDHRIAERILRSRGPAPAVLRSVELS